MARISSWGAFTAASPTTISELFVVWKKKLCPQSTLVAYLCVFLSHDAGLEEIYGESERVAAAPLLHVIGATVGIFDAEALVSWCLNCIGNLYDVLQCCVESIFKSGPIIRD